MRLQYIGKRDIYPVILGHRRYIFRGRGFELDVPDKDAQLILQMASYEFKILPDDNGVKIEAKEEAVQQTPGLEPRKKRGRPRKNDN